MDNHEEVNQHVNDNYDAAHKAAANKDLPGVWIVARPILNLVAKFPLLPRKWRKVIDGLIITIDAIVNELAQ